MLEQFRIGARALAYGRLRRDTSERKSQMRTEMIKHFYRVTLTALSMIVAMSAIAQELKVGAPAPEFKLAGSDGQQYSLSAYKGKQAVALAFFPQAFTGG